MKKCLYCGAQIADDSRFCTECGKKVMQANVCPHCGAGVGDGDVFCYNCGKSLNEFPSSEPTDYEEEEQKSGFKKYLLYIIGLFLLLMVIGYWFSNHEVGSSNDKVVETDTTEVISKEKTEGKDFTDVDIKGVVEDMYKEILDCNGSFDFDEKYTSAEYKSLYEKAVSLSDGPIIDADHWINSQDCDRASVKNVSVKKLSDNEATANVSIKLFKDFDTISKVKLVLLYEGGKWVVDDFITNYDGKESSEKEYLKDFIKESINNKYSSENYDNYSNSSSKTFVNEQYVTMYIANQTFRSSDGFTIRFDGDLRMYSEGDYAGVVSVLDYNSNSAMLRYGGGMYGEGTIGVQIVNGKLQLIDPVDGTIYYRK